MKRIYKFEWINGNKSQKKGYEKKLYNQIRIFTENKIEYFEVKLQDNYTMFCDIKDLNLVKSRTWNVYKDRNTYYCIGYKDRKLKKFHRLIFPE